MTLGLKKKMANLLIMTLFLLTACTNEAEREGNLQGQENYDFSESAEASQVSEKFLVRIEADGVSGSGVIYALNEKELIVLTAAHVVDGDEQEAQEPDGAKAQNADEMQKVTVYFADGLILESTDVICSGIADLARIKIPAEKIPEEHSGLYEAVKWDKESFDKLQAEDICVALGYSDKALVQGEGSILNTWIYVEDYEQYMIWAKGEILPGMSGGGLFDSEGRLIGILSGGSTDGELVAIPLSLILQFERVGWEAE